MGRSTTKRLICPACGDVIGDAVYRRWRGRLGVTSVDGYRLSPTGAALMRRIVESQLTDNPDDTARARLDFVIDNITDPIFDLRCRRGHSTLRTTPQLTRAMVRTPGDWVTP